MDLVTLILAGAAAVFALVAMLRSLGEKKTLSAQELEGKLSAMKADLTASVQQIGASSQSAVAEIGKVLRESQQLAQEQQNTRLDSIEKSVITRQEAMSEALTGRLALMENRLKTLETTNEAKLNAMRETIGEGIGQVRADNNRKLDEIRATVDEKLQDTLQKRIADSFKAVSDQLEQVYKGLGEMQTLAGDVGGLKQILSGVKTRGILGEIQLGAILEEILAPEQYSTNVAVIPDSANRVEFAVRLPGLAEGSVWLPIDSKFPGDRYLQVQEAVASGDRARIDEAYRQLDAVIRSEAKDIRDKYVEPPYTTTFGIMFLPFEGLYAEVINRGLLETLQRDYHVNVAGPSTMAALLNSLQMGFRTLAIQKRSSEVWEVLGAVKTEFEKFGAGLENMQKHLQQTSGDLETLMGTRTRAINRKLRQIQMLDEEQAEVILDLPASSAE